MSAKRWIGDARGQSERNAPIWEVLKVGLVSLCLLVGGALLVLAILWAPQRLVEATQQRSAPGQEITISERISAENAIRSTLIQAFGGAFLVLGAIFTYRQLRLSREQLRASIAQQELNSELSRASLDATRRSQSSEAMTRAVDQFGGTSLATRLGGIASLEQLAAGDSAFRDVVMEMLTASVRNGAARGQLSANEQQNSVGWWGEPSTRPAVDIQLVVNVLGRLRTSEPSLDDLANVKHRNLLDFESSDLRGVRMALGHFEGGMFRRADLSEANLSGGFFEAAVFYQSICERANFAGGGFPGASFGEANLRGCDFSGAELFMADFADADIRGAVFTNANVGGVDFLQARVDASTRFDGAIADSDTIWPKEFDPAAHRIRSIEESIRGSSADSATGLEGNS